MKHLSIIIMACTSLAMAVPVDLSEYEETLIKESCEKRGLGSDEICLSAGKFCLLHGNEEGFDEFDDCVKSYEAGRKNTSIDDGSQNYPTASVPTSPPVDLSEYEETLIKESCEKRGLGSDEICLSAGKFCLLHGNKAGFDAFDECVKSYEAGRKNTSIGDVWGDIWREQEKQKQAAQPQN
ncbi:hypothetical protein NHJ13051_009852 [Beauveria bassiana]